MCKRTPAISHLMYADDQLLMCKANKAEAQSFKKCFEFYCVWPGKKINGEKSNIIFFKNTYRVVCNEVNEIFGFQELHNESVYLGNLLVLSRNKSKEFKILKDKVSTRLNGWNHFLLSKMDKATLIKFVVQAILIYAISTSRIPSGVCEELVAMVRKFWCDSNPNNGICMALKS